MGSPECLRPTLLQTFSFLLVHLEEVSRPYISVMPTEFNRNRDPVTMLSGVCLRPMDSKPLQNSQVLWIGS